MYHVSTQGVDERMVNVHYYYYYLPQNIEIILPVQLTPTQNVDCQLGVSYA